MMRLLVRGALIAAIPAVAFSQPAPTPGQVRAGFQNPPKAYRPMVRWFWPGGDVRSEQLRREVALLDEAHFGGAEIQPFRFALDPAAPADVLRRVNDYRTPTFFGNVRAALEEATRRRMWIDYTFGSGWPFGGGLNITPELAALELRSAHRSITGPARLSGRIPWPEPPPGFGTLIAKVTGWKDDLPPDWPARLKAREKLVAVVAIRGSAAVAEPGTQRDLIGNLIPDVKRVGVLEAATAVVLTSRVAADHTLEWMVPEGEWQLFSLVQFPVDQRVLAGVGGGPQLVLDHFDRHALEAHIRATGDSAIKYLGQFAGAAFRGIFFDSLELAAERSWTTDFLAQFKRLRGYDLTPFLPFLDPQYDQADVAGRIRHDYARTVSDLLIERMFAPLSDWARRHNLIARIQAHGAPTDELLAYGLADIPETENLHAGGRYDVLKLATSAARVYGRSISSAESFVYIMEEYQTTPEKMKRSADDLLAAGVNQIVASGFPYEYFDRPEPGWYPFVSPFPYGSHLNHHDPFWRFIRPLNDYITRVQYLSRTGVAVRPIAIFQPTLGYSTASSERAVVGLSRALVETGYDYDHLNAHALLGARVENRGLVTHGGGRYRQLIVTDAERVGVEVVEQLARFAAAGLPIVLVGQRPAFEEGYRDHEGRSARIRHLVDSMTATGSIATAANGDEAVALVSRSLAPNVRLGGPAAGLNAAQFRIGQLDAFFVRNAGTDHRTVNAIFPHATGRAELWDPWTGTASAIAPTTVARDGPTYRLTLPPYGSTVVVFDRAKPALAARPERPAPVARTRLIGTGAERWDLRLTGRIASGADSIQNRSEVALFDWASDSALKDFSGSGTYRIEIGLDSADLIGTRVELDLGDVRDVAEVLVNGRPGPTLLMRPYRGEIGSLLRPGRNTLEVTVTNPPLNRMIGAGMRLGILFAEGYSRPPKRLPAGLLGPVRLVITGINRRAR